MRMIFIFVFALFLVSQPLVFSFAAYENDQGAEVSDPGTIKPKRLEKLLENLDLTQDQRNSILDLKKEKGDKLRIEKKRNKDNVKQIYEEYENKVIEVLNPEQAKEYKSSKHKKKSKKSSNRSKK